MTLNALIPTIQSLSAYSRLTADFQMAEAGTAPTVKVPRGARLAVLAALLTDSQRPILLVVDRNDRALLLLEELTTWQPDLRLYHFAEPGPLPYERSPWGPRTRMLRLQALSALNRAGDLAHPPILITSTRALLSRTLPPRDFKLATRTLTVGQTVKLNNLLETWLASGYSPETVVTAPGQFSRRGGIVDIWPTTDIYPARIELFGDEVDHIRRFDPNTQRSGDGITRLIIPPAREALPKTGPTAAEQLLATNPTDPEILSDIARLQTGTAFTTLEYYLPWLHPQPTSLLDYLPANALVLADDWPSIDPTANEIERQTHQLRQELAETERLLTDQPVTVSWADLSHALPNWPQLRFAPSIEDEAPGAFDLSSPFSTLPRFGGQLKLLLEHLLELVVTRQRVVIVSRQAARLAELWGELSDQPTGLTDRLTAPPEPGQIVFMLNTLESGWRCQPDLHLFTDAEIFGWRRPEPRRTRAALLPPIVPPEETYELTDFNPNDYVVHVEYGIGRYQGLVVRTHEGHDREFLQVEYAGGTQLYVPIHHADRLTRFVGVDDNPPQLSRLGTSEWRTTRERTRKAIEEKARDMLALYARRATSAGFAYPPDDNWQREMEASFAYIETADQLTAIAAVKQDLETNRPMDRLVCGDVGYGKTEVALRAAFKAVMAGRQVAVLVPTTILAQQHFTTFSQRLAAFPVRVEMLSRFRSAREQADIVEKLGNGDVDIVIGTHRLLSKDVRFQDLGLVVIDEEQRFGVQHKERFKHLRTEVDILTLTATPIPRTLYLSLTGIRDISNINTPPEERLPIITHVGPWEDALVRRAILRELDRGGQVFVVHNRVQTIETVRKRLLRLLPGLRIAVGHGQLNETQLARVMEQFNNHEFDVLLSTTIIESGLDIPNANTLIVDRADMFGLAQLYQLRGRVGRGANRAYSYFFYTAGNRMTPEARLRLETLAEETELGAGYNIAMRDLEIRGAGDILGMRQHGHIQLIGFHLYTRLLRQAVLRLRRLYDAVEAGDIPSEEEGIPGLDLSLSLVSVDLPLSINLPDDYIGDRTLRLKIYRRMAALNSEAAIDEMQAELLDRFGPPPAATENLLYQLHVKLKAHAAGIEAITHEGNFIVCHHPLWFDADNQRRLASYVPTNVRIHKGRILLPRDANPKVWQADVLNLLDEIGRITYPNPILAAPQ